jgi:mRNA interferase MazF
MAKSKIQKQAKKQIDNPKRGDIYLVSFDPTVGHEIKKTRPALVIQNNIGNQYSSLTIVAAIKSNISEASHPVEVRFKPSKVNGLNVPSAILLDQIRSIDKLRLVKKLGSLNHEEMVNVDQAIQISLGLFEF